jgi:hypothetical protein
MLLISHFLVIDDNILSMKMKILRFSNMLGSYKQLQWERKDRIAYVPQAKQKCTNKIRHEELVQEYVAHKKSE